MTDPRWIDYYLDQDFISYWTQRAREAKTTVLVILGLGFDPRCLVALKAMTDCGFGDRLGCIALRLASRPSIGESRGLIEKLGKSNLQEFTSAEQYRSEGIFEIQTHDSEGHYVGGYEALKILSKASDTLCKYTDIIVDISGMPRGIFFPVVRYLIHLADQGRFTNLHVATVEEPDLDACIVGQEYGQADYLHTFRHVEESKTVWLPLVGSNEATRLERIHNKLKSSCIEICPILPFPAESLRRVDDILVKSAALLFEGFVVSQENLILCDERTPFDIYRKIIDVEEYSCSWRRLNATSRFATLSLEP
ncbi:MAG: hypothetical protein NTU41_12805 [Chloroflexi bacterium]|nr:hypothetical protein [Chloroflexota bacterium]